MHTRRDFLDLVTKLAAGAAVTGGFAESIARAAAIEPEAGSTFLDAEHVVILMQENRSFDHAFGALRGVRGFNDPRAITLADGYPVWVQANAAGERYAPFRNDIRETRITWMGCLPHSWHDQVDARNGGLYDRWLTAKQPGRPYAHLPLTLGYYTREDIPFYYALADAFTVCDQYFCSSLTGTTPNRCYLWSGTVRPKLDAAEFAVLRNEEADLNRRVEWTTFPERLEELGVSWKVYQNELTIGSGLTGEEDAWLANFGDNPLEYFRQYHVELSASRRKFVDRKLQALREERAALEAKIAAGEEVDAATNRAREVAAEARRWEAEQQRHQQQGLHQLPPRQRAIHEKAFTVNDGDPNFRRLTEIHYQEGEKQRRLRVPQGDLFHQFRRDVAAGQLPAVSWMVAPQVFSDHPCSAWYGSWYLAEVLDILTSNPAVWKKTIFILTYDENDGYFDHVPPFVAPLPNQPETGRCSAGIDTRVDCVELAQDQKRTSPRYARGGSIGLGYRVPFVIASPWTRGGQVCSQVFDHTSVLQFLERLLSHRLRREVREPNITPWRRAVCGDLTSAFQPAPRALDQKLDFPPRDAFFEAIHRAQFKSPPAGIRPLTDAELDQLRRHPKSSAALPKQEPGTRPSTPLPYQLAADGALDDARQEVRVALAAERGIHGERAAGAPFTIYALGSSAPVKVRNYACLPGDTLTDAWPLTAFPNERYQLRIHGPNGFYRELAGDRHDPRLRIALVYYPSPTDPTRLSGDVEILAKSADEHRTFSVEVIDNAYKNGRAVKEIAPGAEVSFLIDAQTWGGWYDLTVQLVGGGSFARRYAGRVETGRWSISDPAMA